MPPTDYARTRHAEQNRARKAEALAAAAARMGLQAYELTLVGGTVADRDRRAAVRKAAGISRAPSVDTWTLALQTLEALARALPGVRDCPLCGHPVRAVLGAQSKRHIRIDPFPHPNGNVLPIVEDHHVVARVIAGHDTPPDEPLFRQHHVSCPASPQAASRRRSEAPRCPICETPLDGSLAASDPTYRTHPSCDPGGEVRPP